MPGTYAQLAELTKVSPTETATVGLSDAPKTAETVGSGATPITRKNRPVKSPTAALADPVAMGEATPTVTQGRDKSREISSETPREKSRGLPDREEIQEFSFRLRDELKLKVKVQAEVPYQWQDELEEMARKLDVKKLELYRFILGEFLGKVKRKKDT